MKLGVSLVDPTASFEEVARVASLADQLGFHTIWTNESIAREAFVTLTAWGTRTERAVLATGISPISLRPPFFAAMAAATIAEALGPGRFWFGVGSGSAELAARWLHAPMPSPLTAVREYTRIVGRLLRGEEVIHRGAAYSLAGARLALPPSHHVPVLVGALGPAMTDVACQAADGILLNWSSVEGLKDRRSRIEARVGTKPFVTATYVRVAIHDDPSQAAETLRKEFVSYLRFPSYRAQLAALGYPEIATDVGSAWDRGDPTAAMAALPVEVAMEFGVAGTAADCRDQLAGYGETGVEHIVVRPVPVTDSGLEPAVRMAAVLL